MLSPMTRWPPFSDKEVQEVTSSINLRQEITHDGDIWGLFLRFAPTSFCTSFCTAFCASHPDFRKVPHFPL